MWSVTMVSKSTFWMQAYYRFWRALFCFNIHSMVVCAIHLKLWYKLLIFVCNCLNIDSIIPGCAITVAAYFCIFLLLPSNNMRCLYKSKKISICIKDMIIRKYKISKSNLIMNEWMLHWSGLRLVVELDFICPLYNKNKGAYVRFL